MGLSRSVGRKAAGVLALGVMAGAGWFSIELARADAAFRQGTPEGVARAVELAPWNTAYLSLQALQTDYAGGDATPLLTQIARMTPRASAPRIRLGLNAEAQGDVAVAERWLLDAVRVDRQYEPRWTLANFYFRQQRMEDFWKWIRAALEMSYGDRGAAFRLALSADPTGKTVLERAIPPQHDVVAAYLAYLLQTGSGADWTPVALRLSEWRDAADRPALDAPLDRLAGVGSRDALLEIWRGLGYPEPAGIVFNPDFAAWHIGHGLDWQFLENPGVTFLVLETPARLRISFDGRQPEKCVLLKQYVGVRQGKRYTMRWESRGVSSGVAWHAGAASGALQEANHAANDDWKGGEFAFTADRDLAPLELDYARPLGEARVEGAVEVRHVTIEERP